MSQSNDKKKQRNITSKQNTSNKQGKQQNNNQRPNLAPRRGRRRNRGRTFEQGRKDKGVRPTDAPAYKKAEGDRTTIMVEAPIVPAAVEAFPLAFLSVAMAMGFKNTPTNPIYWAYYARMLDIIALLKGQTPVVPARLTFENSIDATFIPKDVPFTSGTIATSWLGTDSILTPNLVNVRSYNYYMYVPGGANVGAWRTFLPPSVPTLEEAAPILAKMYNYISSDMIPHLKYTTKLDLESEYKTDISGFGSSFVIGPGNSNAGGYFKTSEWETAVKAPTMAVFSAFADNGGRLPRYLKPAGGDSTYLNGLFLLPGIAPEVVKSKINPVFCPLDLDEVVWWLQSWYSALVSQAQKSLARIDQLDGQIPDYYYQFPATAQQFRIAVRQAILSMFIQSQACSQFITYTTNSTGFEPLRVGSNAHSKNRNNMTMPLLLIENLRMLLPRYLSPDSKIQRTHNQQVLCPVWGVYKSLNRIPPNYSGMYYNGVDFQERELFATSIDINDPGVIDGSNPAGLCCDLNSPVVDDIIMDWNDRIDALLSQSSPVSYLGGASNGTLLTTTRFAHYIDIDFKVKEMSRLQKKLMCPQFVTTRKVVRTLSKADKTPQEEEVYVPPDGTLFKQSTLSFSSFGVITETLKVAFDYFITPVIIIEEDEIPNQRQIRTSNKQCHILEYPEYDESNFSFATRGTKIAELGRRCAPGIANAGKTDELIGVLQALSDQSQGGFFGNLVGAIFPEIAPIASVIPF